MKKLIVTLVFVLTIFGSFAGAEQISATANYAVASAQTLSDVPPG